MSSVCYAHKESVKRVFFKRVYDCKTGHRFHRLVERVPLKNHRRDFKRNVFAIRFSVKIVKSLNSASDFK